MLNFLKKFVPAPAANLYHKFWPWFGDIFYGHPSAKLKVIGITGTNGKTTVTHLLHEILTDAGLKVASASSLRFKIDNRERPNMLKMTMPGRMKLQKFLAEAVREGCEYAILEVTSEGIKQHRHEHVDFFGSVVTNVTPEHIESHGSFAAYRLAKTELFQSVAEKALPGGFTAVNLDDPSLNYFLRYRGAQVFGYTISDKKQAIKGVKVIAARRYGKSVLPLKFTFRGQIFKTRLAGEYNLANILAAMAAALALGVNLKSIRVTLEKFETPAGRLEIILEKPFRVVVDYAHTPDALEKVYETLFPSSKRLICVIGSAGGGRDRWKRSKMGEVAERFCQKIIVTNEDPYDEDPWQIINEVASNIKAEKILDRKMAVKRALSLAQKGDTVVVTGKGAEPLMVLAGGRKIPWDDRAVAREAAAELKLIK